VSFNAVKHLFSVIIGEGGGGGRDGGGGGSDGGGGGSDGGGGGSDGGGGGSEEGGDCNGCNGINDVTEDGEVYSRSFCACDVSSSATRGVLLFSSLRGLSPSP